MSGFRHIKNEIKRNLVRIPSHVWVMRLLDAQLKPFLVKKICVSSSKTTLRIIPRSHSKGWWQSLQQLGCSLPGTAASVTVVGLMNSYIYISGLTFRLILEIGAGRQISAAQIPPKDSSNPRIACCHQEKVKVLEWSSWMQLHICGLIWWGLHRRGPPTLVDSERLQRRAGKNCQVTMRRVNKRAPIKLRGASTKYRFEWVHVFATGLLKVSYYFSPLKELKSITVNESLTLWFTLKAENIQTF